MVLLRGENAELRRQVTVLSARNAENVTRKKNPLIYTPPANTDGEKRATLRVTWTVRGKQCVASKDKHFKVFFRKYADENGNGKPNWFDYWGDDLAVPGLDAQDVAYSAALPDNTYGRFNIPTDQILVAKPAAEINNAGGFSIPAIANQCPGLVLEKARAVSGQEAIEESRPTKSRYMVSASNRPRWADCRPSICDLPS